MKRTLSLRREALSALTTAELDALGGAGSVDTTPFWFEPNSLSPRQCLATTQDSAVVCTNNCSWGLTCTCA